MPSSPSIHLMFMCFLLFYIIHWFEVYGVFDPRDYRNGLCFNPEKDHEECVPTLSKWDWDIDCKRVHAPYPYGCYENTCSPENEAFFLGNLITNTKSPDSFLFESESEPIDPKVFKNFVHMSLLDWILRYPVGDPKNDYLQLLEVPSGGGPPTVEKVPRICDPRLFLYCDSSFLRHSTDKDAKSLCKCHPLYSVVVHNEDETTECNGRPGVPCQFDERAQYLSVFPDSSKVTSDDGKKSSRCMEGTQCLSFKKVIEQGKFTVLSCLLSFCLFSRLEKIQKQRRQDNTVKLPCDRQRTHTSKFRRTIQKWKDFPWIRIFSNFDTIHASTRNTYMLV